MRYRIKNWEKKIYGLGFGILLITAWQLIALAIDASFILPTPLQVLKELRENFSDIMTIHFPLTMYVVLIGSGISLFLGILFAVFMTFDHRIEKAVYPLLTISQTIPTMCLAPIFILWFGYTSGTRVIIVVLMTFFSITVNVFDGLMAAKKETEELLKTYGADKKQVFWLLRLPTALPNFFTALKVSVPWAVVAASVAEWFGSSGGLGHYSRKMMMNLNAAGLIAPLIIISATALVITEIIKFIENRVVTWRNDL